MNLMSVDGRRRPVLIDTSKSTVDMYEIETTSLIRGHVLFFGPMGVALSSHFSNRINILCSSILENIPKINIEKVQ